MKSYLRLLRMLVFTSAMLPLTLPGAGWDEHPFFKHLTGKWETEGELTGQDGNKVKITGEWTGSVEDESFVMEGSRTLNETVQTYRWTLTKDDSTGAFAAMHMITNDSGNSQRFEANVSEAALTMELTAFLGSGNAKVVLKDSFVDETWQVMQSEVTFTDDQGNTTLSGTIIYKKVAAP